MVTRRSLFLPLAGIVLLAVSIRGSRPAQAAPAAHIVQSNWDVFYTTTATDGLRVSSALFRGHTVFAAVTVPQIRVHYSWGTLDDQLGGNIPFVSTTKVNLADGFELQSLYQMAGWPGECTYKYLVRYRFHANGNFEPWANAYGPGCDNSATYEVFWRMDFDIDGGANDYFHFYEAAWGQPAFEGNYPDNHSGDSLGREWRNRDGTTGRIAYIRPDSNDNADLYALRFHGGQGDTDLSSITQPSAYDNSEQLQGNDIVDWYVAHHPYTRPAGCPNVCNTPVIPGPYITLSGY